MTHTHINLFSVKGGQGVSTTAVLLAKQYAQQRNTVLLVDRPGGDLPALLGIGEPDEGVCEVNSRVSLLVADREDTIPLDQHDVIISDRGGLAYGCLNLLVTHPDYVSMRHARDSEAVRFAHGVIIVRPDDRVLTDRDVVQVVGLDHIATINMTKDIASASDAGLLLTGKTTANITLPLPV